MSKETSIKLFEQKQVRSVWDDKQGNLTNYLSIIKTNFGRESTHLRDESNKLNEENSWHTYSISDRIQLSWTKCPIVVSKGSISV